VIHPRVAEEMYQRLRAYSARRRVTVNAVVVTALRQYLDQTSDATLLMRRLDRLTRRVVRVSREVELALEFLSVWSRFWFAHTPQLPEEAKAGANKLAAKRYEQMVDHLGKHLAGPQRLATEVFGKGLDDEEPADPEAERNGGSDLPQ
jgi:hypothetical protein